MTSSLNVMPGFHVCFVPRGKRVAPPVSPPLSPEDIILSAERTHLALMAAAEEANPIRLAIELILQEGLSMAQACKSVDIEQYKLNRAIKRITRRLGQEG